LNKGQRPKFRGVRAALGSGYNHVEGKSAGNSRDPPPKKKRNLDPTFAVYQFVADNSHERLWRLLAEHSLHALD
jgi:hypothetical protein